MVKNTEKMKLVNLYLFFLVAVSACANLKEISGEYSSRQIPYVFYLNKDSTFYYHYQFQFDSEYSFGKWRKIGKKAVILNSHYKKKSLQLISEHNNTVTEDHIIFNIVTPDFNRNYYECLIFVNGALWTRQKCDSTISVSIRKPIMDVFLGFTADRKIDPLLATRALDTIYTEKLYPQDAPYDKYTLRIVYNDSLFNYKVFDDEVLKITKKGLIFYDPKRKTKQSIPKR